MRGRARGDGWVKTGEALLNPSPLKSEYPGREAPSGNLSGGLCLRAAGRAGGGRADQVASPGPWPLRHRGFSYLVNYVPVKMNSIKKGNRR